VKVTLYGLSFLSADKAKYTIKVTNPSTKPKPTSPPLHSNLKVYGNALLAGKPGTHRLILCTVKLHFSFPLFIIILFVFVLKNKSGIFKMVTFSLFTN
jgi:hypothetical protein